MNNDNDINTNANVGNSEVTTNKEETSIEIKLSQSHIENLFNLDKPYDDFWNDVLLSFNDNRFLIDVKFILKYIDVKVSILNIIKEEIKNRIKYLSIVKII